VQQKLKQVAARRLPETVVFDAMIHWYEVLITSFQRNQLLDML
jgi:hypothetical protein